MVEGTKLFYDTAQRSTLGVANIQTMATAAVLPSEDGLRFAIPEGTTSITQPDWCGEGRDSLEEWGVDKEGVTTVAIPTTSGIIVGQHRAVCCPRMQLVSTRCHSFVGDQHSTLCLR